MISTWEGTSVYLVDEAAPARDALASGLTHEGFHVDVFPDLDSFQRALVAAPCDIAVIDILLDPGGGYDLVAQLRSKATRMGIVIHSAITCLETRLQCLESGADAYLIKPVDAREVATQLRVLERRLKVTGLMQMSDTPGDWALIEGGWTLRDPLGHKLTLTTAERNFLLILFARAGQPVPREELLASLGVDPRYADPHRLDVLVNRLRAKALALDIKLPLRSVRSRGYVLAVSNTTRAEGAWHASDIPGENHCSTVDFSYPSWE